MTPLPQLNLPPTPPGGLKGLFLLIGLCVTIGLIGLWALRNLWRMLRGD